MANEITVVFPYEKLKAYVESGEGSQYLKITVGYNDKGLPDIWATLVPFQSGSTTKSGAALADDNDGDDEGIPGCPLPPGC